MADSGKEALTLVVIGPKHVGKTVYLTALANCPGVILSDPDTLEVIKLHWNALQAGAQPDATSGTIADLHFSFNCQTDLQTFNMDFTVPDYDGHFAETLSQYKDSPDIQRLRDNIKNADGFIVFMPLEDEDQNAIEEMRHEIGSFINIVREVYDEEAKIPVPLIIAVNKWDKSADFKDANEENAALEYIQSQPTYALLYERLCGYFAHVSVIPLSAYGHPSPDGKPVPGAINPYRVTDPIVEIISVYLDNLSQTARSLEAAQDWPLLARVLLNSKKLWQRLSGENYGKLLDEALNNSFLDLKNSLSEAGTIKQYDALLASSPCRPLLQDFTPAQSLVLDKIAEPLREAARRSRLKQRGIVAAVLAVCLLAGYAFYVRSSMSDAFREAMAAPDTQKPGLLRNFVQTYEGNPVASLLGGSMLAQVRSASEDLTQVGAEQLEATLTRLEDMQDVCGRAEGARQLEATVRGLEGLIPAAMSERFFGLLRTSEEVCQARTLIQKAQSGEELDEATALLAGKPASPEVEALHAQISEARTRIVNQIAEEMENARIEPILNEYTALLRSRDLKAALDFIEMHAQDASPRIQDALHHLEQQLEPFYFQELSRQAEEMDSFDGESKETLDRYIQAHGSIQLTQRNLEALSAILQRKAAEADAEGISHFSTHVSTQQGLEDAQNKLQKLMQTGKYSLPERLFEYQRPEQLVQQLNRKRDELDRYPNAIKNGLRVNWQLIAEEDNKISLNCENFITPDARAELLFNSAGLENKTGDDFRRCEKRDGGRGYVFHTAGVVKIYKGAVTVQKNRRMMWNASCNADLNITGSDIISLVNGQAVTKRLCGGTSLRLEK